VTYDGRIRRGASILICWVVELEYICEKNIPSDPGCSSIKGRFDPPLCRVIDLDAALELFRNGTPSGANCECDDVWDEIDEDCDVPGDENVGCGPEEPGRDGISDIGAVFGAVGLEIVYTKDDWGGGEKAGCDHGSNECGKEKDNNSERVLAK
jgi:hypothetical protein